VSEVVGDWTSLMDFLTPPVVKSNTDLKYLTSSFQQTLSRVVLSNLSVRYDMIYLLNAVGLLSGGSTHLQTNNTNNNRTTQITINVEEYGPCPVFASFTLTFALQLRKKHGKTSVRVRKTLFRLRKTSVRVQYVTWVTRWKSGVQVLIPVVAFLCTITVYRPLVSTAQSSTVRRIYIQSVPGICPSEIIKVIECVASWYHVSCMPL